MLAKGGVQMKTMKLYADVHRIHNSLAAMGIGPHDPLSAAQLAAFDQYHYGGTQAVDLALGRLGLKSAETLLDIGSGIGGPARHVAATSGARVTALELQADLDAVARDLTLRCGLSGLVTHQCGDILDGKARGPFDGIMSLLCMLHIPDKARLFAACRSALKPGRAMYVEDFARARPLSAAEEHLLAVKVQSVSLPTPAEYRTSLAIAGFAEVEVVDVTREWQEVSAQRVKTALADHDANVAVHGPTIVAGLEDFYMSVDNLWQGGALAGLRILAR